MQHLKPIMPSGDSLSDVPFRWVLAACVVVFVIALVMRLLFWEQVFVSGRVHYYDPDCYMRLRKIMVYLTAFPKTAIHDYYQGFPHGTGVISPPTMEYLLAAVFWPFRSMSSLLPFVERLIAFIPPIIGALTAALLCRFTAGIAGVSAGFFAGLMLAILPVHIDVTVLGRFDNEMAEPLLLLIAFWGYTRTYYATERVGPWVFVGAAAFLYLSLWRGGVIFLTIIGVDMLLRLWLERDVLQHRTVTGNGAVFMYGTTAGLLALVCSTNLWGSRQLFSYNIISWFHVVLFAGAGGFIWSISRGLGKSRSVCISWITGWIFLMLLALGPEVLSGISVLRGGNPWLDSISQYQRYTDPATLLSYFGLIPLLFFPGLYLLIREFGSSLRERRFLVIWCLAALIAAVVRWRYAGYFGLNVAFAAAISVSLLIHRFRASRSAVTACAFLVLLLFQAPALLALQSLYKTGTLNVFRGTVEDSMMWLREHTPSAGDSYRPDIKPAYGVLARWDFGGWIETVAQRPTLATSYGTETYGMEETARFFLATDETKMAAVLRSNGVRYLMLDSTYGTRLPMYAALIGEKCAMLDQQRNTITGRLSYTPNALFYNLIASRLYYADGSQVDSASYRFAPVEGVRLRYESSSPANVSGLPWYIASLKVFEYLPGATLSVLTAPESVVRLTQLVETNIGRRFEFRNEKKADKEGHVSFTIVYGPKNGEETGSVGPVGLEINGRRSTLTVTSADIEIQKNIRAFR